MHRRYVLSRTLIIAVLMSSPGIFAQQTGGLRHVVLAGHRIGVEIARTDIAREHGLMKRTHMAASHGMLFVYPDAQLRYFWMKDTLIPLDILFFDAQRRLINVSADTPPCKADPCPTYGSTAPAKFVLELNAGSVKKLGIKAGERFKID